MTHAPALFSRCAHWGRPLRNTPRSCALQVYNPRSDALRRSPARTAPTHHWWGAHAHRVAGNPQRMQPIHPI
eukprot:5272507-Pleurochrysis_carterae.AAC.1